MPCLEEVIRPTKHCHISVRVERYPLPTGFDHTRIDDVLDYYLEGYTPEEILAALPTLNLEKIHATITYYLHNRAQIDAYLLRLAKWREQRYQEWATNPSLLVQRLRALQAHRAREQESSS